MMVEQPIKQHLMDAWQTLLLGIDDGYLRSQVDQAGYVAGGAIASLLQDQAPKDYDVFFLNKDTHSKLKDYFGMHPGYTEGPNSFMITLSGIKYNFIGRIVGPPATTVSTFDFFHTHSYWEPLTNNLVISPYSREKTLIYNGNQALSPAVSMRRVFRFLDRGYTISLKEVNKIIDDIAKLDMSNPEVKKYNWIGGVY